MFRRAPNEEAMSFPLFVTASRSWKSQAGIFSFLSYLACRETVHKTQPFDKLKQTFSKELQENCTCKNLTAESVIKYTDPQLKCSYKDVKTSLSGKFHHYPIGKPSAGCSWDVKNMQ